MSYHTCHAQGCEAQISPGLLMCLRHWRMVPLALKRAVSHAYAPGEERTKSASGTYLQAARAAIAVVAEKEKAL